MIRNMVNRPLSKLSLAFHFIDEVISLGYEGHIDQPILLNHLQDLIRELNWFCKGNVHSSISTYSMHVYLGFSTRVWNATPPVFSRLNLLLRWKLLGVVDLAEVNALIYWSKSVFGFLGICIVETKHDHDLINICWLQLAIILQFEHETMDACEHSLHRLSHLNANSIFGSKFNFENVVQYG